MGRVSVREHPVYSGCESLSLFSPTMKLLEDIAQVLVGDVGVDLCGADVAVAEHTLDTAQVGTVHQ